MCDSSRKTCQLIAALFCLAGGGHVGVLAQAAPDAEVAPGYTVKHFGVREGLPVENLTDLARTPDGYLWMSSYDGLVRFDGARFVVFTSADVEAFPSNRITSIHQTRGGVLWLVFRETGTLVRYADGRFQRVGEAEQLNNRRWYVQEGSEGVAWARFGNTLYRWNGDALEEDRRVEGGQICDFDVDPSGTPWVGLLTGVLGEVERDSIRWYRPDALVPRTRGRCALDFGEDGVLARFEFFVLGRRGPGLGRPVERWRLDDTRLVPLPLYSEVRRNRMWQAGLRSSEYIAAGLDEEHVPHRFENEGWRAWDYVRDGPVWYARNDGVYRNGRAVLRVPRPVYDASNMLVEDTGTVWAQLSGYGLYRIKPTLFRTLGEAEGLRTINLYAVIEARKGGIYVSGSRRSGNFVNRVPMDQERIELLGPLGEHLLLALYQDRAGGLWVSGAQRLCRFPPDSGPGDVCVRVYVPYPTPSTSELNFAAAIHEDSTGIFWFGTTSGLFRKEGDGWTHYGEAEGIARGAIRTLIPARGGGFWLGIRGSGVVRFDPQRPDRSLHLSTANGLPSDIIRPLYEDARGVLWIGTEDKGLARYDPATGALTTYRVRNGLYDRSINSVLEDDFGRLWMSTNRGIFWVTLADLEAFAVGEGEQIRSTAYTEADGLRNRETNGGYQNPALKASDGRLWFVTQEGVAVVDPSDVAVRPPPPVVVEAVVTDGTTVSARTPVELAPSARTFSVEYTALNFETPENTTFQYRLDGYDERWVDAQARRSAFYTKVPAGSYTFRVRASTDGSAWSDERALAVRIEPFFYETGWFYALAVVLLVGGGIGTIRWREQRYARRQRQLDQTIQEQTAELRHQKQSVEQALAETEAARRTIAEQAEQLRDLDEAKGRFFANVSHAFRTPLTLTIGSLETITDGEAGAVSKDAETQVDVALRNARVLLRLVGQLLDLAKVEAGAMQLHARVGELGAFLRALHHAFHPLAERDRIVFALDLPGEPIHTVFDAARLETVLLNLLSNAFKFTPVGGVITLGAEKYAPSERYPAGRIALLVRDSGPGIPEADLPHLFDRFYQVGEAQAGRPRGTGIGLALVKELTALHGGHVEVDSEEGTGTTMVVWLPVRTPVDGSDEATPTEPLLGRGEDEKAEHIGAAVEAGLEGAEPDEDRTTILVAEDNAELRALLRYRLASEYRVLEASDGEDALAQARHALPDLIVSDVMMPRLDGFGLCRALKSDPATDFIPIILLTARAGQKDRLEGLRERADDYLTKPFDAEELRIRIRNLIALRQRLTQSIDGATVAVFEEPLGSDEAFVLLLDATISKLLGDPAFSTEPLAAHLGQSRSTLYRRVRRLTGEAPSDRIRRFRLEQAARLLEQRAGNASEIAYSVGFKSVSHFSKSFRKHFGVPPTSWLGETGRPRG